MKIRTIIKIRIICICLIVAGLFLITTGLLHAQTPTYAQLDQQHAYATNAQKLAISEQMMTFTDVTPQLQEKAKQWYIRDLALNNRLADALAFPTTGLTHVGSREVFAYQGAGPAHAADYEAALRSAISGSSQDDKYWVTDCSQYLVQLLVKSNRLRDALAVATPPGSTAKAWLAYVYSIKGPWADYETAAKAAIAADPADIQSRRAWLKYLTANKPADADAFAQAEINGRTFRADVAYASTCWSAVNRGNLTKPQVIALIDKLFASVDVTPATAQFLGTLKSTRDLLTQQ